MQFTLNCLNPFDIRATAWTYSEQGMQGDNVLIPLISGQLLGQLVARDVTSPGKSLNPFDIRATAWTAQGELVGDGACRLNPFDIRATAWTHTTFT